jgi:chromosomal replication initiation ATPase DnaA
MKILSKEYSAFRKAWVIWYEYAGLPASATFKNQYRADSWILKHRTRTYEPDAHPETTIKDTIERVCEKHKITKAALTSKCRKTHLVTARKEVAEILEAAGYSYSDIGRALNRDHSTVLHFLGRTSKAIRREEKRAKKAQIP